MADKKVKAWAVVADGHERDAFDGQWVFTERDEADAALKEWGRGYRGVPFRVVPCTITLHMPKRKGRANGL